MEVVASATVVNGLLCCGGISSPTTYNTTQSKNDGDLRKFPSIPYKTAQAGTGGNL